MSQYDAAKFLYHFNRDARVRASYALKPARALASYTLAEPERDALLRRDFCALYDIGIHPLLLMFFARYTGTPTPAYLEAIRAGQAAKH